MAMRASIIKPPKIMPPTPIGLHMTQVESIICADNWVGREPSNKASVFIQQEYANPHAFAQCLGLNFVKI